MQIKYNYTSGLEFNLNGVDYVGYFNVDENGNAYTEKYYSTSSKQLTPYVKYISDLKRSTLFQDRLLLDTQTLSYTLSDILIQPNELSSSFTLITKLQYLSDNNLQLFSKLFVASTDIPTGFNRSSSTGPITENHINADQAETHADPISALSANESAGGATNYSYIIATAMNLSYPLASYGAEGMIKKITSTPLSNGSGYGVIGITDTFVVILTADNIFSGMTLVAYTSAIGIHNNETNSKLQDITYDGTNLFISSSGTNQIYKYNIDGLFKNDITLDLEPLLVGTFGGLNVSNKSNTFITPATLGSGTNRLLVSDTKGIKVYDSNFVYITTINFPLNEIYNVVDIKFRKLTGHLYFLLTTANSAYIKEYDSNFTIVKTTKLVDTMLYADEKLIAMNFAEQDSNVLYVLSNYNVYKKFITNLSKTFAMFNLDNVYGGVRPGLFKDFIITPLDTNYENVFILENGNIFQFQEQTKYDAFINNVFTDYYNKSDVDLLPDEYMQAFTLNKELYKLYFNTLLLKNNIKGKSTATFDKYGLVQSSYQYIPSSSMEALAFDITFDTYVNDNEAVSVGAMNGVLSKIFNLQQNILKLTETKFLNNFTVLSSNNIYTIA